MSQNMEAKLKNFGNSIMFEPVSVATEMLKKAFPDSKTDLLCREGFIEIKVDDYVLIIDSLANMKVKNDSRK